MIEAVYLAPDFLEDLVSNNLLDAVSGGVIRVELLCQIALERSIPKVADVLTVTIVAGVCSSFDQLRLCHQGTMLPALPLLVDGAQKRVQSFVLRHRLLVADEIPLMEVVEIIQEELQIP